MPRKDKTMERLADELDAQFKAWDDGQKTKDQKLGVGAFSLDKPEKQEHELLEPKITGSKMVPANGASADFEMIVKYSQVLVEDAIQKGIKTKAGLKSMARLEFDPVLDKMVLNDAVETAFNFLKERETRKKECRSDAMTYINDPTGKRSSRFAKMMVAAIIAVVLGLLFTDGTWSIVISAIAVSSLIACFSVEQRKLGRAHSKSRKTDVWDRYSEDDAVDAIKDQIKILNVIKNAEETDRNVMAAITDKIGQFDECVGKGATKVIFTQDFITYCVANLVFASKASITRLISFGRSLLSPAAREGGIMQLQKYFVSALQICVQEHAAAYSAERERTMKNIVGKSF